MSNYLIIGGWSGPQKIAVDIAGETPEQYEIRVLQRVYLPGRGLLEKGQSAFVPRRLVRVKDGEQTPELCPEMQAYLERIAKTAG